MILFFVFNQGTDIYVLKVSTATLEINLFSWNNHLRAWYNSFMEIMDGLFVHKNINLDQITILKVPERSRFLEPLSNSRELDFINERFVEFSLDKFTYWNTWLSLFNIILGHLQKLLGIQNIKHFVLDLMHINHLVICILNGNNLEVFLLITTNSEDFDEFVAIC